MGLIRFLLAISVVIAHSSSVFGFKLVGGQVAVQAFYIISGFYMTLILNEKYIGINNSYKLFITNRLLRLYPIYWTILIVTIFTSVGMFIFSSGNSFGRLQPYYENIHFMDIGSVLFLFLSNLIIFFQDVIMFLGLDTTSGELFFTAKYRQTDPILNSFLLVPQAWTIGIEITFYLIAPFLVRKNISFICGLMLISALLRVQIYEYGLQHDPWTYRFFPTELFFFLLGTMAYHAYIKIESLNLKTKYLYVIYATTLLFIFFYSWLSFQYKGYLFFIIFFLTLPFIFILSKKMTIDRYIGELSYPIYLSHIFVLMILEFIKIPLQKGLGIVTIILTILFSILLNEFVAKKIELIRQSRLKPISKNIFK